MRSGGRIAAARRRAVAAAAATTLTDTFADSQTIDMAGPNGKLTANNTSATMETGEPTSVAGFTTTKTMWVRFVAPITGRIGLGVTGQNNYINPFDALIGVYTGTAVNALTQVASSDPEVLSVQVTAGTSYHVQVGGFGGASGAFDFHWTANDELGRAHVLTTPTGSQGPHFVPVCTFGTGEPTALTFSGGTVWYRVKTGATGGASQFDLVGTAALVAKDPVIAVYTSSAPTAPTFASLTQIAANDQFSGNDAGVTPTLLANTDYFIQVMPSHNQTIKSAYKFNWSVPSVA